MLWGKKILNFVVSRDRKYRFLVIPGQKISIFGGLGTENVYFWCSGGRKYRFLVFQRLKISIFAAPGQKIKFWTPLGGGDPRAGNGGGGILGPPN